VRQRLSAGVGVTTLVLLVFALNFYRLPVVALTPGPAEDVLARVKVEGSTAVFDSKGKLYLTSVGIDDDVRFYEALLDLANRDVELRPRAELFPDGDSSEEIDRENVQLMDQSKTIAKVVALRELGYPVKPSGVEIGDVVRGTPADGRLEAGDQILQVDGHTVASIAQVRKAITSHRSGERVAFLVARDDTRTSVAVRVAAADDGQPRVGVELRELFERLPVKVSIETENIGGPSAGLMFALSIIDRLTAQDLTGGRRIAGTGELSVDGEVLPIGGVAEKLVGARRQGATVFLVPADNCPDVRGRVPAGLRLVRVATLDDALRFLRQPDAPAPSC
jgi:PDZ domain-containing protein